jgi:hypothetical protein
MTIKITGIGSLKAELRSALSETVEKLADEILVDARSYTPIKTGRARNNWRKTVTKDNFEVINRVPYIERLEAGASKQAPKGIIGPTLTSVKGKV